MINIYLSSGMSKFGKEKLEEGDKWRQDFIKKMSWQIDNHKIKYFNPNDYFSITDENVDELEAMKYDLHRLHHADLVVYCATDPNSLGSMAEIAIAYTLGIPVLVLNEKNKGLHPWIEHMAYKMFDDMQEMVEYIGFYFL